MELGTRTYVWSFPHETNASNQIINCCRNPILFPFYNFSSLLLLVVSALPDMHEDLQTERCMWNGTISFALVSLRAQFQTRFFNSKGLKLETCVHNNYTDEAEQFWVTTRVFKVLQTQLCTSELCETLLKAARHRATTANLKQQFPKFSLVKGALSGISGNFFVNVPHFPEKVMAPFNS